MHGTIANSENTVHGTVAIIRSEPSDLDWTTERRPNSRDCSYCSRFRGSHSIILSKKEWQEDLYTLIMFLHGDHGFTKVKFSIPPFNGLYDAKAYLDWEMTVEQKFSSHIFPEQHRVRQATSLKILLLSDGMSWLPLGYNQIHEIG
jgi:hypothetical protein